MWDDKEILSKADQFRPFPYILRIMGKVRPAIARPLQVWVFASGWERCTSAAQESSVKFLRSLHRPPAPQLLCMRDQRDPATLAYPLRCVMLQWGKASTPSGEWQS